jgi:hypothetical protein
MKVELSKRAQNSLRRILYDKWWPGLGANGFPIEPEAVARIQHQDLARHYNTGRNTVANIEAWLADHGLTLANTPPEKLTDHDRLKRALGELTLFCMHCRTDISRAAEASLRRLRELLGDDMGRDGLKPKRLKGKPK